MNINNSSQELQAETGTQAYCCLRATSRICRIYEEEKYGSDVIEAPTYSKYPSHITDLNLPVLITSANIQIWLILSIIKPYSSKDKPQRGKSNPQRGLPWGRRCESHGTFSLLRPVTERGRGETSVMIRPQCNYRATPLTVIDQWGTPLMKTRTQGLPGANWQK